MLSAAGHIRHPDCAWQVNESSLEQELAVAGNNVNWSPADLICLDLDYLNLFDANCEYCYY